MLPPCKISAVSLSVHSTFGLRTTTVAQQLRIKCVTLPAHMHWQLWDAAQHIEQSEGLTQSMGSLPATLLTSCRVSYPCVLSRTVSVSICPRCPGVSKMSTIVGMTDQCSYIHSCVSSKVSADELLGTKGGRSCPFTQRHTCPSSLHIHTVALGLVASFIAIQLSST